MPLRDEGKDRNDQRKDCNGEGKVRPEERPVFGCYITLRPRDKMGSTGKGKKLATVIVMDVVGFAERDIFFPLQLDQDIFRIRARKKQLHFGNGDVGTVIDFLQDFELALAETHTDTPFVSPV